MKEILFRIEIWLIGPGKIDRYGRSSVNEKENSFLFKFFFLVGINEHGIISESLLI